MSRENGYAYKLQRYGVRAETGSYEESSKTRGRSNGLDNVESIFGLPIEWLKARYDQRVQSTLPHSLGR